MSVPGIPLRMEVNSAVSLERRIIRPSMRLGPRPPSPFAPWQPLQEAANSFFPARIASGWAANGFRSDLESGSGNCAGSAEAISRNVQMVRIGQHTHYHKRCLEAVI